MHAQSVGARGAGAVGDVDARRRLARDVECPRPIARDEHAPAARADQQRHRHVILVVGRFRREARFHLHRPQLAAMLDGVAPFAEPVEAFARVGVGAHAQIRDRRRARRRQHEREAARRGGRDHDGAGRVAVVELELESLLRRRGRAQRRVGGQRVPHQRRRHDRRSDEQPVRIEALAAVEIVDGAGLKRVGVELQQLRALAIEHERRAIVRQRHVRAPRHERHGRERQVVSARRRDDQGDRYVVRCAVTSTATTLLTCSGAAISRMLCGPAGSEIAACGDVNPEF